MDISASGMRAERIRMEVLANNVANAHSTQGVDGAPFQRQMVLFKPVHHSSHLGTPQSANSLQGVEVSAIVDDPAPPRIIHDPNHPDADEDGNVYLPNISLPREMVDLMTAQRAYEANLKSLQTFRNMAEQALTLLRGANS
jgi:flagellar basal-body rod protein FlgC